MDYADGYLWLVGSHSTKRKRAKRKEKPQENIQRLQAIETDANRYLLARLPIVNGVPVKCDRSTGRSAARLRSCNKQSELIAALEKDEHIGPILKMGLPSKDNGFDIEAIAVRNNQLFLGLRGPVLRGMAIILEIELETHQPGLLQLKTLENKQLYRKHFIDLNGLGVRDMCFHGDDLIILAGPTMSIDGLMQIFCWKDATAHDANTLWMEDADGFSKLTDVVVQKKGENAEGIALFPVAVDQRDCLSLIVVYDSPSEARLVRDTALWADVLRISKS